MQQADKGKYQVLNQKPLALTIQKYKLSTIENRPNFWFVGRPTSKIEKEYLFSLIYVFVGGELPRIKT